MQSIPAVRIHRRPRARGAFLQRQTKRQPEISRSACERFGTNHEASWTTAGTVQHNAVCRRRSKVSRRASKIALAGAAYDGALVDSMFAALVSAVVAAMLVWLFCRS